MPYQTIVQSILSSSEIRISNSSEPNDTGSFVRALAFVSPESSVELSLEDKGGHLELRVEPRLRSVDLAEICEWHTVLSGVVHYVEILERWFIEEPSQLLGRRFAGLRVVTNKRTLEADVDDNMVGAFVARMIE